MLNQYNIQSTDFIGALVKTSLVDYPKKVSAVLFLHGCNLRCPYCYNKDFVTGTPKDYDAVTFNDVISHLIKRKNVLSGFVISGGEPCLSPLLHPLIRQAHNLGYLVKLDTNGTIPEKLENLFSENIYNPDFVAMDIKTSLDNYSVLGYESCESMDNIRTSIDIISKLPTSKREFRTVLVPTLVTKETIKEIASILPKDSSWQFAKFQPGSCLNKEYNTITPYTQSQMNELVDFAKSLIPNATLR